MISILCPAGFNLEQNFKKLVPPTPSPKINDEFSCKLKPAIFYWVAYRQTQSRSAFSLFVFFFTGLPIGKPSRGLRLVCLFSFFSFSFFFFFFFRVGKSLACHSPGKWCLCA